MDWLTLLLAGGGSAYGAFIPVYLTAHAWTQTRIGLVLTVSTVVGMLCQVPAGLLVDAIGPRRRTALYWAIVAAGLVPMVFVILPRSLPVLLAMAVQAAAGSIFTPAVAAISLALVGRDGLGERVGRNGRYGSIGAGMGAAVMGACGYLGSPKVAFVAAAALTVPALLALRAIGPDRAAVVPMTATEERPGLFSPFRLLRDRRLLIYALCVALFQVASIAVLQLSAVDVTARLGARGALVIAAFLIVPQVVVAVISPWLGKAADRFGHRVVLLVGFATVPVRGVLFALVRNPYVLVPVQVLEGAGGAAFGVMMPLVAADLTQGKGHYTLCLSLVGLAAGAGTAISTALAGWTADHYGRHAAFWVLAAAGVAAVALVALAMPETRRGDAAPSEPGEPAE
jgi:MFS family permease